MDEDMMGMDVAPVMDPQQMNGMPPQGMMMPGTPPAQEDPAAGEARSAGPAGTEGPANH